METALREVRGEIEALYAGRGDDFILPARYQQLIVLEAHLMREQAPARVA
jgi:hypothetical protein